MNGLPEIVARRATGEQVELDLIVSADSPWFSGHFPGQPILPGVVQVGWAAQFAADACGFDAPPTTLERVKFKRPILPAAQLTLLLASAANKVRYDYRQDGDSVSSGVLCFGGAA